MIIVGARNALPSEEERYLDMLMMVREAMLAASTRSAQGGDNALAIVAWGIVVTCGHVACLLISGELPPGVMEDLFYAVTAVSQTYEHRDHDRGIPDSATIAAMYN